VSRIHSIRPKLILILSAGSINAAIHLKANKWYEKPPTHYRTAWARPLTSAHCCSCFSANYVVRIDLPKENIAYAFSFFEMYLRRTKL